MDLGQINVNWTENGVVAMACTIIQNDWTLHHQYVSIYTCLPQLITNW